MPKRCYQVQDLTSDCDKGYRVIPDCFNVRVALWPPAWHLRLIFAWCGPRWLCLSTTAFLYTTSTIKICVTRTEVHGASRGLNGKQFKMIPAIMLQRGIMLMGQDILNKQFWSYGKKDTHSWGKGHRGIGGGVVGGQPWRTHQLPGTIVGQLSLASFTPLLASLDTRWR